MSVDQTQQCASKHGKQNEHDTKAQGHIEAHRIRIDVQNMSINSTIMKKDVDNKDWESDDEYHDSMPEMGILPKATNIEALGDDNNDHETEEDDEYFVTLVDLGSLTKIPIDLKNSINLLAKIKETETTDNENEVDIYNDSLASLIDITTADSGIDEDEEYYDSLTCESAPEDSPDDAPDSEKMHNGVRGSLSLTQRKRTLTMSPDSPKETEYWDPVSDTYRNKRTNKSVTEESRQEKSEPTGYETDSSIESEIVSSVNLDSWEYWDPVTDSYINKRLSNNPQYDT